MVLNIFKKSKKDDSFVKKDRKKEEDTKSVKEGFNVVESASKSDKEIKLKHSSLSFGIIKEPHISEKASNLSVSGKYVFKVMKNSNKIQIKKAVESLYNVKVKSVNIITIPSKKRKIGKFEGVKSGYKKATITLSEGQTIDVTPR